MQLQFLEALKRPDADIDVRAILVRGNHDKKGLSWYTDFGWDFVCDGIELIYHGNYLYFTHRHSRPTPHAMCNIHGHAHGNMHRSEEYNDFYDPAYHLDISPELRGFKPLRYLAQEARLIHPGTNIHVRLLTHSV